MPAIGPDGLARQKGLLVGPTDDGKALAGTLHDLRLEPYPPGTAVLFLMPGGNARDLCLQEALAR